MNSGITARVKEFVVLNGGELRHGREMADGEVHPEDAPEAERHSNMRTGNKKKRDQCNDDDRRSGGVEHGINPLQFRPTDRSV